MASLFGQDLARAAKKARDRNKPKGFFGQIKEGLTYGLSKGLGEVAGQQILQAPLDAYAQRQEDAREQFLSTEIASQAKRNNKNMNDFLKQYRAAQDRSVAYGTSFESEFANAEMFKNPAIAEMRKKDFITAGMPGAISDEEINAMTLQSRIEEVKRNRETYDDIFNKAKGISDETQFADFLKREAPRSQGVLASAKNFITSKVKGQSLGELAEQRILNDDRYKDSLSALAALEKYRDTRNEGAFMKEISAVKLDDIPKPYYMKTETATTTKQFGKFFQDIKTTKTTNLLDNTVTVKDEVVPNTVSLGVSKLATQVDVNKAYNDLGFDKKVKQNFTNELNRRLKQAFPDGIENSQGVRDEVYNFANYENYNTADGMKANLIATEMLVEMGKHKVNFVDYDKIQADAELEKAELAMKYGQIAQSVESAYSADIVEKDNKIFVRKDGILLDPEAPENKDNAFVIGKVEKYIAGQKELMALQDFMHNEKKIALGLGVEYIQVQKGNRKISVAGEDQIIPVRKGIAIGSLGYQMVDGKKAHIWDPKLNLTAAEKAANTRKFESWEADRVVRFDPREVEEQLKTEVSVAEVPKKEVSAEEGTTDKVTTDKVPTDEVPEEFSLLKTTEGKGSKDKLTPREQAFENEKKPNFAWKTVDTFTPEEFDIFIEQQRNKNREATSEDIGKYFSSKFGGEKRKIVSVCQKINIGREVKGPNDQFNYTRLEDKDGNAIIARQIVAGANDTPPPVNPTLFAAAGN